MPPNVVLNKIAYVISSGHRDGLVIIVDRMPTRRDVERCCVASEGAQMDRRTWADFCELQGLSRDFDLSQFTQTARYRAVGNGVPVPMARIMAQAIVHARKAEGFALCVCGCGRSVIGRAISAGPACRKRVQRKRESVTHLVCMMPAASRL